MPLDKSGSAASVGKNIKELEEHGTRPRSHKQILAIALDTQRRANGESDRPRRFSDDYRKKK